MSAIQCTSVVQKNFFLFSTDWQIWKFEGFLSLVHKLQAKDVLGFDQRRIAM